MLRVIWRPAASPPTWELVRPPQMMTRSLPSVSILFFWSLLKPRPSPTSRMTDAMPQMIPNIVRKLRILWARSVAIVCLKMSRRFIRQSRQQGTRGRNALAFTTYVRAVRANVVPTCGTDNRPDGSVYQAGNASVSRQQTWPHGSRLQSSAEFELHKGAFWCTFVDVSWRY